MELKNVLFIVVFLYVVFVGILAYVKSKKKEIESYDSLSDYLYDNMKEKILPFIFEIALKEQLLNSSTVEEFKNQCIEDFSEQLYKYISENIDEFKIPDNLKDLLTKETIKNLTMKICDIDEVDLKISQIYDKHWSDRINEIEKMESEECDKNIELGDVGPDFDKLTPFVNTKEDETQESNPEIDQSEFEEVIDEEKIN